MKNLMRTRSPAAASLYSHSQVVPTYLHNVTMSFFKELSTYITYLRNFYLNIFMKKLYLVYNVR